MTAVAPAPTHLAHASLAAPAGRVALPPAPERSAFAAVLESMPNGDARTRGAPPQKPEKAPDQRSRSESPQAPPTASQSPFSASLAAMPAPAFALPAVTEADAPKGETVGAGPQPAAAARAPAPDDRFAPQLGAASQGSAAIAAKLVGERTFHASVAPPPAPSPAPGPAAARASDGPAPLPTTAAWREIESTLAARPTTPPQATAPSPPPTTTALSAVETADRPPTPPASTAASGPSTTRADRPVRVAENRVGDPGRWSAGRQPDPARAEPATGTRAAPPADEGRVSSGPPQSDRGPPPDPEPAGSGLTQSTTLVVAASPPLQAAEAPAAAQDAPSPASARAPAASRQPPPVKEIDVDLSPSGLENVSMTMRLSGDRLSLVVRASSPQTAGAIEGAREAIAERLAAIGQPLGAFIIQQTGSTTDANASGASNGENGGDATPQQGGRDEGRDPHDARRGADRF